MLIDHDSKKIFLHIPKVGGMSIRNYFEDNNKIISINKISVINGISLDETHFNMKELSLYRPKLYQLTKDYKRYILLRDPVERFHSSVAQHIRMYSDLDFFKINESQYIEFCIDILNVIRNSIYSESFDYKYIHFRPQSDFYCSENSNLYKSYSINNINECLKDFTGKNIPTVNKQNESVVLKKYIPNEIMDLGRFFIKFLSVKKRNRLKSFFKDIIFVSPKNKFDNKFLEDINIEVAEIYKKDYLLIKDL